MSSGYVTVCHHWSNKRPRNMADSVSRIERSRLLISCAGNEDHWRHQVHITSQLNIVPDYVMLLLPVTAERVSCMLWLHYSDLGTRGRG